MLVKNMCGEVCLGHIFWLMLNKFAFGMICHYRYFKWFSCKQCFSFFTGKMYGVNISQVCGFTGQYAQRNAIHGIKMMVNLYYHNDLQAERIPFDGQLTSRLSLQPSGVWVRPRYDTPDGCRLSLTSWFNNNNNNIQFVTIIHLDIWFTCNK